MLSGYAILPGQDATDEALKYAMRWSKLDILTAVTALATLSVAGATFWDRTQARPTTATRNDQKLSGWEELLDGGHRIGSADLPVQILEFGDYECPVCRTFHSTLKPVLDEYAGTVAFVYRHFPLSYHKQAYAAARAAECAAEQSLFFEYHNLLYEHPDPLGNWRELATLAEIPNLEAFEVCAADNAQVPRIEEDIRAARSFGASGTPTVIVNGIYLGVTPDSAKLRELIATELAKRD